MWFDSLLIDHPGQHRCRTVGRIPDEAPWRYIEVRLDSINHELGGLNLCGAIRRRRFHIHDDTMGNINQIVRRIGKEGRPTGCGRPT